MAEGDRLAGDWVEIVEAAEGPQLFLRRSEADIPPTRGSRRHLHLDPKGQAENQSQGAADRLETRGSGIWTVENQVLHLTIPGWEGDYDIETPDKDTMILHRR